MIKGVIRLENDLVVVFDENDQPVAEYQGRYSDVRDKILRDAPPEATFGHVVSSLKAVPREQW